MLIFHKFSIIRTWSAISSSSGKVITNQRKITRRYHQHLHIFSGAKLLWIYVHTFTISYTVCVVADILRHYLRKNSQLTYTTCSLCQFVQLKKIRQTFPNLHYTYFRNYNFFSPTCQNQKLMKELPEFLVWMYYYY